MERERLEKKKKLEQQKPGNEKGSPDKVKLSSYHQLPHSSFSIHVVQFYEMFCTQNPRLVPEYGFTFKTTEHLAR